MSRFSLAGVDGELWVSHRRLRSESYAVASLIVVPIQVGRPRSCGTAMSAPRTDDAEYDVARDPAGAVNSAPELIGAQLTSAAPLGAARGAAGKSAAPTIPQRADDHSDRHQENHRDDRVAHGKPRIPRETSRMSVEAGLIVRARCPVRSHRSAVVWSGSPDRVRVASWG